MNDEEKLDKVLSQVNYITGLLENNTATGQKGAIHRISILEERVEEIEIKDKVRLGRAGAYGSVITLGLYWIGKLLIKFFF